MTAALPILACLLAAMELSDGPAIGASLDDAEASLGVAGCIDEIVVPALREFGQQVTSAQLDIGRQRMATEAVRAWLNWRTAFAMPQKLSEPVLLACGPRDRNVVILEALALVLRTRGLQTRVLGTRVPTDSLVIAARATGPAAVVVLGEALGGRPQATSSLMAVDDLGYQVFFLGNALAGVRSQLPGHYLGATIGTAADRITTAIGR